MGQAWIEHLPWVYALVATLVGLELLRRLRLAHGTIHALAADCDRINLSLDLVQAVGQMGSWQYAAAEDSPFWSDEVFAIHGRDPKRGQPLLHEAISYFHPDDRVRLADMVQRSLDHGEDFDIRGRVITDDGITKEVLVRSTCRFDRNGQILGVIGFIIDLGPV